MSEEILKSLAQLYAIITKQDGGVTDSEKAFVVNSFKKKLNLATAEKYISLYEEFLKDGEGKEESKKKLTSVKDSVKTLGICRKINKTLTQKQKIVVLVELLEILKAEKSAGADQQQEIVDTVAIAFNIEKEEYKTIQTFVLHDDIQLFGDENILVINNRDSSIIPGNAKHIHSDYTDGNIFFVRVKSVDMIFMKYTGNDEVTMNSLIIGNDDVTLFSQGSTAKTKLGGVFYYSDVLSHFISESATVKLSFQVNNLEFRFSNHSIGLRDINISEGSGKLIGIMGASGAGKTTLLNVLAGLEMPHKGEVLINGFNLHKEKDKVRGVIGYIPQDDLLIEELTVFENLFYSAKLCFKDKSDEEITEMVNKVLDNLGLIQSKDLRVGNVLNKSISGGQRKRLNIALELIREPSVLFVDEPTSGLSSRDSENVMDLLKELTLKGTLIFVVIHQPSSDIYKMFDKMFFLDVGGFPIYYGNPVEAITYFKKVSQQADSDKGQCTTCGNVNPEQIFNIIEEKVVDEYGHFTASRKLTPKQWNESFVNKFTLKRVEDIKEASFSVLKIPNKVKQFWVFTVRDFKSKLYNRQYMLINLIEAPLLAFILSFILRYNNNTNGTGYVFRYNENIPAYILMSIVIAIFIGLSISAEEIIKDKKILKRETFLNLSRNSYLISKVVILFLFSAVQTLTFVLVGNSILAIKGMYLEYWLVLFSVACFANLTGLIISSAFDTAITVYILVPLLLIPQMILSGSIFSFDKINDVIRSKDKAPVVADLMASRWAYEAIAVKQFRDNGYEKFFFKVEQKENIANYHIVYLLPELSERLDFAYENLNSKSDSILKIGINNMKIFKGEMRKENNIAANVKLSEQELESISFEKLNNVSYEKYKSCISGLSDHYTKIFNQSNKEKENYLFALSRINGGTDVNKLKDNYFNESLSDLVRNATAKKRIIDAGGYLAPKTDYIYFRPVERNGKFDYRAHFFSPEKHFMGIFYDTFKFNIFVIWLTGILLYIVLYFDLLRRLLKTFGKVAMRKT
jgi:ABC-type multidrug transport system ATPase subunit